MKKIFFALLLLAAPAQAQTLPNVNLVLEPFHASNIYKVGERVGWTGRAALGGAYTKYGYEIRENNFNLLKSGVLDVASGEREIEHTRDHPGMIYARLSFMGAPPPTAPTTAQE